MYKLLMLDLDGTLVDSAPEITDAANCVLRGLRLSEVTEPQIISWIGSGSREVMVQAVAHAKKVDPDQLRKQRATLDHLMRAFAEAYEKVCGKRSSLYPRVRETLDQLKARHLPLALITNKESRLTTRVLERHRLQAFFDLVIGGDTLPRTKPDPLPVQHCLQVFGVPAKNALLVGDSSVDVASAHAAGVDCWVVPYGYNRGRPIADAKPDRVIPDLSTLLEVFPDEDDQTSVRPSRIGMR